MTAPQSTRDTEVISLRTSREFKDRLRDWADGRGIPMTKLLEEMGELYSRAEAGAERKLSPVELLLRPHFQTIERELVRAFEENEAKGNLFKEESDSLRIAVERLEKRQREEKLLWETDQRLLNEKIAAAEKALVAEREARIAAEQLSLEANNTARVLTNSMTEARTRLEELKFQVATLPEIKKERDELQEQLQKVAVERETAELNLARAKEDLLREKEASARSASSSARELHALEKEYEARILTLQLETEKASWEYHKHQEEHNISKKEQESSKIKKGEK